MARVPTNAGHFFGASVRDAIRCNLSRDSSVPPHDMKTHLLCWITSLAITGILAAAPTKGDAVEEGLRDAYKAYQAGRHDEVTDTLRNLLKLMEEKNAKKVEGALPETINGWNGNDIEREDLTVVGGGLSLKRTYQHGEKSVTVKVVKDSPLVDQWLKILANEDLIRVSGKKTYNISGETAFVEGKLKVIIAVEGEILVELKGDNDCKESDLISLARKLNLKALKKMKELVGPGSR